MPLQVQDHEVAIVELEREVQELRLFCLDTVNRCETVPSLRVQQYEDRRLRRFGKYLVMCESCF